MAGKPKKTLGKNMGLGADMQFRVIGEGERAMSSAGGLGGRDWGNCAHITSYKGLREWHLFRSLA